MCTSKNCKARVSLVFDAEYIIIDENGQFDSELNSEEKLNTTCNFRYIRILKFSIYES